MFFIYVLLTVSAMAAAFLSLVLGRTIIFLIPTFQGPVFQPTADNRLATMLELAELKSGEKILDFGSGDGKILLAVAKQGYSIEGVELNPLLVRKSRKKAEAAGLDDLITIYHRDFWKFDLSGHDVIFLYGITYIMPRLEKKMRDELKPGARVISNYFQFPKWKPVKRKNHIRVYQQPAE